MLIAAVLLWFQPLARFVLGRQRLLNTSATQCINNYLVTYLNASAKERGGWRCRRSEARPKRSAGIRDGAVVAVNASSGLCCPDAVLAALGERFADTRSPRAPHHDPPDRRGRHVRHQGHRPSRRAFRHDRHHHWRLLSVRPVLRRTAADLAVDRAQRGCRLQCAERHHLRHSARGRRQAPRRAHQGRARHFRRSRPRRLRHERARAAASRS